MRNNEYSDLELSGVEKSDKIYTIDEIKEILYDIFKKYQIKKAYLFGSYARGEATKNSDIDIMIKEKEILGLFLLSGLLIDLENGTKKKVDLIVEKDNEISDKLERDFYNEVNKERVLIYE